MRMLSVASVLRVLTLAFAVAPAVTVSAEDVADRPALRIGDWWAFRTKGEINGTPVDRQWRRRIAEFLPDGKFRVEPRYNGRDVFDPSWNELYPDRPDFPPLSYRFPLRVGDSWSYASPLGARTVDLRPYDNHGQMKVVAYESLTVPAGTFRCFRIEGESHWIAAVNAQNPDFSFTERWQIVNWYCPEIRYIGKSHTERFIGGLRRNGLQVLDHELIDYKGRRFAAASTSAKGEASAAPEAVQSSAFDGRWRGEQGIWRVSGRVKGEQIEGNIRCHVNGKWSAATHFVGTVGDDGSIDAETTNEPKGWAPRRIEGRLPALGIVGYGALDCPNGEVALKKVESTAAAEE